MFDGGGTYNRVMNYTNDKNAGIHPQASRFDTEMSDIASALSMTFLRNGSVAMTGALNMGTYSISGANNIGCTSVAATGAISGASASITNGVVAGTVQLGHSGTSANNSSIVNDGLGGTYINKGDGTNLARITPTAVVSRGDFQVYTAGNGILRPDGGRAVVIDAIGAHTPATSYLVGARSAMTVDHTGVGASFTTLAGTWSTSVCGGWASGVTTSTSAGTFGITATGIYRIVFNVCVVPSTLSIVYTSIYNATSGAIYSIGASVPFNGGADQIHTDVTVALTAGDTIEFQLRCTAGTVDASSNLGGVSGGTTTYTEIIRL